MGHWNVDLISCPRKRADWPLARTSKLGQDIILENSTNKQKIYFRTYSGLLNQNMHFDIYTRCSACSSFSCTALSNTFSERIEILKYLIWKRRNFEMNIGGKSKCIYKI